MKIEIRKARKGDENTLACILDLYSDEILSAVVGRYTPEKKNLSGIQRSRSAAKTI